MAQSRSQRMKIVLQLSEKAEQEAAEKLGDARQNLHSAQEQLSQLEEYQQEYVAQINAKSQKLSAREMISDRSFIGQLEEAAVSQQQKLAQLHKESDGALQVWQAAYHKRNSIEEMINKMRLSENAQEDKRFQQEMDELSSLAFRRKG